MSKYLSEMKVLGTELAQSILPHDKKAVAHDLIQLGREGWQNWFEEHFEEILEYMGSQPAIRKKKWAKDIQNHRRLVLGALVLHRAAIVFQGAWEQHDRHTGLGYRDAHKEAADRGWGLSVAYHRALYMYPFDNLHIFEMIAEGAYFGPTPFLSRFPVNTFDDLLVPKKP